MPGRVPVEEMRIADDWLVGDVQTIDDCDEALVLLTRDIHNIDIQIAEQESAAAAGGCLDSEWLARAKGARAVKNVIKGIVQRKQGELNRVDRSIARETWRGEIIESFRNQFPLQFAAVVRQHRQAGGAE